MTCVPAAAAAVRSALAVVPWAVQTGSTELPTDSWSLLISHIIAVVVFAAIGMVVFALGIWLFVKLCPFSVRKEIEEDQNTALGIIMGSVLLGLSLIIAAAIVG